MGWKIRTRQGGEYGTGPGLIAELTSGLLCMLLDTQTPTPQPPRNIPPGSRVVLEFEAWPELSATSTGNA